MRDLRHRVLIDEERAMNTNIISAVSQVLTPEMVARMASASGIADHAKVQTALGAAVPAILSRLASLASEPGGEQRLADAIAKQPPRAMESLSSMAGDPASLMDAGKGLISSLLGPSSLGSLAGAIGRYTGLADGVVRSLLGMLTPVVGSVLGREAGHGATALAQMLTSQRDAIAAAMPPGLSDALHAGERIGTVGAGAARATAASAAMGG